MLQAISPRFVPAAAAFLLACVCVLFLAAASTFLPSGRQDSSKSRAEILSTLLR
jgi:hypothetical protein